MTWEEEITFKANKMLYEKAWVLGQQIRDKVEALTEHFFEELVSVGIGVEGPPTLGEYTPTWEPLSDSWTERKGNDFFYYYTGELERTLLRKGTLGIFGRPQVYLQANELTRQIVAREPAAYLSGKVLTSMSILVVPFPRLANVNSAEELVAGGEGSKAFFKLVNPKGQSYRPLVSPFVAWYINVKIKNALRGMVR